MPFQGTAMPVAQAYYRVAQVAAIFNVHRATVYREIKAGRLDAVRIGGTMRVPAAALSKYESSLSAVANSAELTVDTPLGTVDLVAIERARAGQQVSLTKAESALLGLLASHTAAAVA